MYQLCIPHPMEQHECHVNDEAGVPITETRQAEIYTIGQIFNPRLTKIASRCGKLERCMQNIADILRVEFAKKN